ncbi:MAG: bifunctional biotin--[acetyl-CoA-carboxylase] ligase/biotin operon repressor BirA [Pseudohongiellaceae bacterium]
MLNAEAIRKALSPGVDPGRIDVVEEIDSTNAEALRRLADAPATPGAECLLVARSQTAGRGRRGRQWLSPQNAGIYLSLTQVFEAELNQLQALSLVTALSVAQAIDELGGEPVQLKWPNDVLAGNKKLAGILLETSGNHQQPAIVFGIGINLKLPAEVIEDLGRPVTDLSTELKSEIDAGSLIASICNRLFPNLKTHAQQGFIAFQDDWNSRDRYLHRDVILANGNDRNIGRALGVDAQGALLLQTAQGIRTVSGGEIFPSLYEADKFTS